MLFEVDLFACFAAFHGIESNRCVIFNKIKEKDEGSGAYNTAGPSVRHSQTEHFLNRLSEVMLVLIDVHLQFA